MHIVYLHQYFATPSMPEGTRSYEMAKRLVSMGHRVSMVTSYRHATDRRGWYQTNEAGIEVHWLPVPYSNRMSYSRRIFAFFQFALRGARRAATLRGDIVFATSTPLTIALPGRYASRRSRVPMVFEVRDMWPDVPIAMGILRNSLMIRAARALERSAYRWASHIVALAPGMRDDIVEKGVPFEKITVIPNGCDNAVFGQAPVPEKSPRAKYEWLGHRPLVLYPGAVGRVNGVSYLVDVAKRCHEIDPEIRFVVIGAGSEWELVRDHAARSGVLDVNFFMFPALAKSELTHWVVDASMLVCLIGPKAVSKDAVQNKFFDAMAAGIPTASNFEGFQTHIAKDHDIGIVLDPDDTVRGATTLVKALRSDAWLAGVRTRSKALAEGEYSRDHQAMQLRTVLETTVADFARARGARADERPPRPPSIYRQVARMHIETIGRGFLSSIGEEFLALVYRSIDEDRRSALFVEQEGTRVIGFVSGTTNPRSMYRQLLWHLPAVIWSLRSSLISPKRLAKMCNVARYMRGGGPKLPDLPPAELLSMAVATSHRGCGVAERLFRRLEHRFDEQGVPAFRIIVGEPLVPAQRFYQRMGAQRAAHFEMHQGAKSLVFVRQTLENNNEKKLS